ncbi:MAG TPA: hypothetical protein VJ600_05125 [Holophagaceae bacterium]|nr:hypothetical protein [Holophagaceae bacterium]
MTRTLSLPSSLLGASALALLVACGGGGGSDSGGTTPPANATKLVYTNPTSGAYQLQQNTTLSTPTHLVLDVVGNGSANGAGLAFSFSLGTTRVTGWTKVASADTQLVENGNVLNLGAGTPILKATTVSASGTQTLSAAVAQKGTAGSVSLNGALALVALDLRSGTTPGSVPLSLVKAQVLDSTGTVSNATIAVGTLAAQ